MNIELSFAYWFGAFFGVLATIIAEKIVFKRWFWEQTKKGGM